MKKRILSVVLFFCAIHCYAQKNAVNDYYYYRGEKKKLNVNKNRLVVYFEKDIGLEKSIEKQYNISRKIKVDESLTAQIKRQKLVSYELKIDSKRYNETYNSLKTNSKIKAVEKVVGDSIPIAISNYFYVKLKQVSDSVLLFQKAKETNTQIVRRVAFTDKWFVLETSKRSISNSLTVSNIFYETGLFDKVDPGFIFNFSHNCVVDTRYSEQWAIDNTGIDINACNAWNKTTGNNNIILAIIDRGIDNGHMEFTGINFAESYDAEDRTSPAQLHGNHGTHVCGIIGSNHNQASIAGVAPGLSIMEISHSMEFISTISEDLATGINWAVQNGAHILNNSWGDQGGAFYNNLHSELLEDAIDNALNNGRDGLGAIVVFASGNNSPAIDYPAYYRPEILVAGSIASSGQRSSFSGFGNNLDIVAPGSAILSTTMNNQYASWSGTSMAAPHISAVAGLILSVRPDLTGQQVRDIIEQTAQKVGGYSYSNHSGRPNGTWDDEMGYGLVDAYAAVYAVAPRITGPSKICYTATYTISNLPAGATVTWTKSDNLFYVSGQGTNTYKVEIPSISLILQVFRIME